MVIVDGEVDDAPAMRGLDYLDGLKVFRGPDVNPWAET